MAGPTNSIESRPKAAGAKTTCAITSFDEARKQPVITGVFQDVTITECQFKAAKAARDKRQEYADTRGGAFAKTMDGLYKQSGAGLPELQTGYIHLGGRHSQAEIESGDAGRRGAKVLGAGSAYPTGPNNADVTPLPNGPKDEPKTLQLNL